MHRSSSLHARPTRIGHRPPAALVAALLGGWLAVGLAQPSDPTGAGAAVATGSGPLEASIEVEKLLPAEPPARPTARFVPVGRLEAGDTVHYTIRVRNPGREAVRDVQVTKRLPVGLHYQSRSAAGPASTVEFSADGGQTFVKQVEGADYTHVRWTLQRPLAPGATALLRFSATFR